MQFRATFGAIIGPKKVLNCPPQDEKERTKELHDWRLNKLEEAYDNKRRELREARRAGAAANGAAGGGNETALFQKDELEIALEDKEAEVARLKEEVNPIDSVQINLNNFIFFSRVTV